MAERLANQETSRRTSATYRQSMTDKGFVQVAVWVPAERKAELQQIATKMRNRPA